MKTTFHAGLKNDDVQTSSSQVIGAGKVFDAFGNELSSTGAWKSQFGYAGKFGYQQDADSGLKLLGHRYYDSSTGRFLTRDPIKHGRNWYGYCNGNLISGSDPSGLIMTAAGFSAAARAFADDGPLWRDYMDMFNDPTWGNDDNDWNRNQDCAGFVCYLIFKFIDPNVPQTGTGALLDYLIESELWEEVPWDPSNMRLEPGDIIITGDGSNPGHVGIYVGNDTVAHASLGNKLGPHTKRFWGKGGFFNGINPRKPRVFRLKGKKKPPNRKGIRVDIIGLDWRGSTEI